MGEAFAWITIAGVPVLIGVGIWCLRRCEGKARKYLVWDTLVFFAALALLFGGDIVLGFFGLAWRNLPGAVLWAVLVVSFLTWIILTLRCSVSQMDDIGWVNKGIIIFFGGVVLLMTMWLGLLIFAFGYCREERVLEYQGQPLVEVDMSWLHPTYHYYEYRGPLFQGSELIYREHYQIDRKR